MNTIINTNVSALNAHRSIVAVGTRQARSAERLASGQRINRAADDAAGLAISEKMRNQIRGINQAERNSRDGISLMQTAEGALEEIHRILERTRVLTNQAANDVNTQEDRMLIWQEVDQILAEVDHIARNTEFNTLSLLQGDPWGGPAAEPLKREFLHVLGLGDLTSPVNGIPGLQFAPPLDEQLGRDNATALFNWLNSFIPQATGIEPDLIWADGTPLAHNNAGDFPHGWSLNNKMLEMMMNEPLTFATEAGIIDFMMSTFDERFLTFDKTLAPDQSRAYNARAIGEFFAFLEGVLSGTQAATGGAADTLQSQLEDWLTATGFNVADWAANIDNPSGDNQPWQTLVANAPVSFLALNAWFDNLGREVMSSDGVTTIPAMPAAEQLHHLLGNILRPNPADFLSANFGASDGERPQPINELNLELQTGANSMQRLGVDLKAMSLRALGLGSFSADFETAAVDDTGPGGIQLSRMLDELDWAINYVSTQRATLGAVQNRLEHTINNLQVAAENTNAANSRIRDTDMALEMMNNTQANVLQQAAISMLAQANMGPQNILQLLQ